MKSGRGKIFVVAPASFLDASLGHPYSDHRDERPDVEFRVHTSRKRSSGRLALQRSRMSAGRRPQTTQGRVMDRRRGGCEVLTRCCARIAQRTMTTRASVTCPRPADGHRADDQHADPNAPQPRAGPRRRPCAGAGWHAQLTDEDHRVVPQAQTQQLQGWPERERDLPQG